MYVLGISWISPTIDEIGKDTLYIGGQIIEL